MSTVEEQRAARRDDDSADGDSASDESARKPLVIGLLTAPGLTHRVGLRLRRQLSSKLSERFPGFEWKIVVREEVLAGASLTPSKVDLVQISRRRMLEEGWDFAICLTDLPLHLGRRPVTANASVALGVGLVSLPALGAVDLHNRATQAVLRVVDGLLGERADRKSKGSGARRRRTHRMRKRLHLLSSSPVGREDVAEDRTIRFVTAVGSGNFRLLIGMVRANRPWLLISGLSRALVGALGTTAFGLASTGVWKLADGMGWGRLIALSLGSVLVTCLSLILVHGLWERSPAPDARERVVLFNLATAITITLGVLTLYVALMVIITGAAVTLIAPNVLESEVHHSIDAIDYLRLAWVLTSLATLGGALGAAVESDDVVRAAAYGYHPHDDEGDEDEDDQEPADAARLEAAH
ncbi:MAG TPA: hypothetical protein VGN78_11675 [Solirubrobacteraceae bacterium]|jgi:uncharacterized membrane protein|nr:hypothetical protein [Solirubrobacteraceae bacterium]